MYGCTVKIFSGRPTDRGIDPRKSLQTLTPGDEVFADGEHELQGQGIAPPTATRTDLAPVLQPYIEAALADRTRQEYRADLRRFLRWGGTLPTSPDVLAAYLVAHATDHAMAAPATLAGESGPGAHHSGLARSDQDGIGENHLQRIRRRHGPAAAPKSRR